ncbi:hypothetical protein [uncultured Sphingomonas sp.]|uniref:hypothetical protein n=1 Tax=uncultured Sphingomonas sp. TaxID=158754 RepID=UPI0025D05577|nr:hypothetical protein [uncultured Sphingomonas sp.]
MAMTTAHIGEQTVRRANGQFGAGNRFGGRTRGAKGKFTAETLDTLGTMLPAALEVIRDRIAAGDLKAALFCIERLVPPERLVEVPTTPEGLAEALEAGDLTVGEATRASAAIKALRETMDLAAIRAKVDELEALIARMKSEGR